MFINFRNIWLFVILAGWIINGKAASKSDNRNDCLSNRNEFESASRYWKYIVEIYCKKSGRVTFSYGVILSEYILLTNFAGSAGRRTYCYIADRNRSHIDVKEGNIYWVTKIPYKNWEGTLSGQSLRQIQLILTEVPINLAATNARAIRLPRKEAETDNCVVVGLDSPENWSVQVVNRKVDIIETDKCYSIYRELDHNIICIQIPKEFNTCTQCKEYVTGSPLICNGVLTAIVGFTATTNCDVDEPRSCAKVYESLQWIKSNMESFSKDSKFKQSVVWIGFKINSKLSTHSLGVIIGVNKILTAGGFDFSSNTTLFKTETGKAVTEGVIYFDSHSNIYYKNLINSAPNWPLEWSEIQLSVISLENDINLSSSTKIMPLPIRPMENFDNCFVASKHPTWIKYKVDILSNFECRKALPNHHKDYMCIRLRMDGLNHCTQLLGGSPLICNSNLVGIVARYANGKECIASQPRVCSPVYKYLPFIQSAMLDVEVTMASGSGILDMASLT
uniref:Peptidase S1 domain-containing protein n=1 Tax=Glossina brevipalpis TaxID=37001 RepID=A0A1A9WH01_9MUSC